MAHSSVRLYIYVLPVASLNSLLHNFQAGSDNFERVLCGEELLNRHKVTGVTEMQIRAYSLLIKNFKKTPEYMHEFICSSSLPRLGVADLSSVSSPNFTSQLALQHSTN